VLIVNVAVTAPVPVSVTDGGTLQVGVPVGLVIVVVTAQARATIPLNPFDGVAVSVAVLPVVIPGRTVTVPLLLSAKPGSTLMDVVPKIGWP